MKSLIFPIAALLAATAVLPAQSPVDAAATKAEERMETANKELAELQKEIEAAKVPLQEQLSALEDELIQVRKEYDRVLRLRDGRTLDVTNLKRRVQGLEEQEKFLVGQIDDFANNLETRLDIAEAQHLGETIFGLRNRAENVNLEPKDRLAARLDLVDLAMTRIEDAVGGHRYPGTAADDSGVIHEGTFLQLGPVVWFSSTDGTVAGVVNNELNSAEPVVVAVTTMEPGQIASTIQSGQGDLPLDVTLGSAIKVEEMETGILDEVRKGGTVMYPMLTLAGVSLLIALLKWIQLSLVQRPSGKRRRRIFGALEKGDTEAATKEARKIRGPLGKMLVAGIDHHGEPSEVIEEAMFEETLHARTKLNSFLPFIAITAAASPLLGLLGTVTGMINTFKLITIYGTGDAGNFSAGISEALITTKWGLIVAIPSLLLHAFLSRKAKAVLDDMEKTAISFMGHAGHAEAASQPVTTPDGGTPPPDAAPAGA